MFVSYTRILGSLRVADIKLQTAMKTWLAKNAFSIGPIEPIAALKTEKIAMPEKYHVPLIARSRSEHRSIMAPKRKLFKAKPFANINESELASTGTWNNVIIHSGTNQAPRKNA